MVGPVTAPFRFPVRRAADAGHLRKPDRTTAGRARADPPEPAASPRHPEKLDLMFEPFVQLGRSLSSPHEGTGLGLAISRDLARAMDGDLTVQSVPGTGSTFTLTLPR
ncbi:MAG: ATP-binding protein, partial [Longimicrobiales bacterium]